MISALLSLLGSAFFSCSGGTGNSSASAEADTAFVTVRDGQFYIGDSAYRYVGTNFWYGAILASEGRGGNRERLARELDSLQQLGVSNLRILAGGDARRSRLPHRTRNADSARSL